MSSYPDTILTKEDWIATAIYVAARLPAYMASQRNNVEEDKIADELNELLKAEDWKGLHRFFQTVWNWLPDTQAIRVHPFGPLCDLCSEYWVFSKENAA